MPPRKLSKRAMHVLKQARKRFIRKFGREPGPDDPVFFDEESDVPKQMDPAKFEAEILELLKSLPPQFLYAYRKTGLLGLSADKSGWPQESIDEWDAALDEYFELEEKAKKH